MTYPAGTDPDVWADAFEQWLQKEDSDFGHDGMADWFEAAMKAGQQATSIAFAPAPGVPSSVDAAKLTPADGVWVATGTDHQPGWEHPHGWFAVYPDELEALRRALRDKGEAEFVEFGKQCML